MSELNPSPFAAPQIDARSLLGLYDPADATDWGPIRAAQLAAGGQLALFLFAANAIGATMLMLVLAPLAPLWVLGTWAAATTAVAAIISLRRLTARDNVGARAELRDVRSTFLEGVALGLLWAMPPLAFGALADTRAALGLWIILSILTTASAGALAALTLATLSFVAIVGLSTWAALILLGAPLPALAAAIFSALLLIATYARGRSLVVIRATELALAERDAAVGLLLREHHGAESDLETDWLWEIDANRVILRTHPRFARALGVTPDALNDQPILRVLAGKSAWESGKFPTALHTMSEKLRHREGFCGLLLPVEVDGSKRWFELSADPRFDEDGRFLGFRGVGSDVTLARESAEQISRMARFDTLTGLPNRLLLNEALSRALAEEANWSGRCALLLIDLDRFKAVNDTLGHPVGDRLLLQVSERLRRISGEKATIARLGGDEFALVVRDTTDTDSIEDLARRIIDTLSQPYDVDHHTLYIGASIGLAIAPRDGQTAETLIRSADLALYRSKDAGGGVFNSYVPELHSVAEERRLLEIALRGAITRNELHIEYQPVVDTDTAQLQGFEALLRWTHPKLGKVSPAKFVPIAEEARLIAPIGEWVLNHACAEAVRWGGTTTIAVNVSLEQLHNPGFAATVEKALKQTGLPPERLELEVTESVFMREGTVAVQVLENILDLGVRLSLDDFGTGYSSLGYLPRTRFSSIKIDRSFVQGATQGVKEATAIVRAVVALADSLGMGTTAEGVETEEEYAVIRALGCTKVQGYYFGRPLPVEDARALALAARESGRESGSAAA